MKRLLLTLLAVGLFAGSAHAQDRGAVLDSLQYSGFRFFWYQANPLNGMCPDRSTPGSVSSIASTGFGLSAMCVGADHGWITRDQAKQRVITTLRTFWNGPQGPAASGVIGYKGLYYHWLDMNTATRRVDWNAELSTIDTALLFAGILHCREYFSVQGDSTETLIRALADSITWRAEWDWTRNGTTGIQMGWNPGLGFAPFGKWTGYNEAMIMYILAIGSPTHPIPATDWRSWTGGYNWGQPVPSVPPYVTFPPLFGHQYSHCWIDFRGVQDSYMQAKGITYFENSKRATLAQIAFARSNGVIDAQVYPAFKQWHLGESDSLWGFTACDGPTNYLARGAPLGTDDGTIAPTAAISSVAFAPDSVWPCIRNMWNHRNSVFNGQYYPYWGPYGFGDAFNPVKTPWFTTAVLGIDQGPIVLMLENSQNNMVWARFMQNADIQRGLSLAGFAPVASGVSEPGVLPRLELTLVAEPNPFVGATTLRYRLGQAGHVRLRVYDITGRQVTTLVDADRPAGEHVFRMDGAGLAAGVYLYRLEANGVSVVRRAVVLK